MSRWKESHARLVTFWYSRYGESPAAETLIALSVAILAMLHIVALAWLIPSAIIHSLRKGK
jgi:vacuolar-type H+-ATPase subunit I/STV1